MYVGGSASDTGGQTDIKTTNICARVAMPISAPGRGKAFCSTILDNSDRFILGEQASCCSSLRDGVFRRPLAGEDQNEARATDRSK